MIDPVATLPDAEAVDVLRVEYRRVLLRLAARDLYDVGVDDVAAELVPPRGRHPRRGAGGCPGPDGGSGLALPAVGDRDGEVRGPRAQPPDSDVDVIFVHEPAGDADDNQAMKAAARWPAT